MGFGSIFNNAWKEFFDNIGSILLFLLVFLFVPFFIFMVGFVLSLVPYFVNNISKITNMSSTLDGSGSVPYLPAIPAYSIVALVVLFIFIIVSEVFVYASFYGMSVKNSKYSFKELAKVGKSSFWRMLGRGILFSLIILLLYVLFIIPGIIFSIYWIFAMFIWFNEPEKGFGYSLRKSMALVKGRWWKTFGYLVLLVLLFFVAYMVLAFIPLIGGFANMILGFYLIYFLRHMYIEYSKKKV